MAKKQAVKKEAPLAKKHVARTKKKWGLQKGVDVRYTIRPDRHNILKTIEMTPRSEKAKKVFSSTSGTEIGSCYPEAKSIEKSTDGRIFVYYQQKKAGGRVRGKKVAKKKMNRKVHPKHVDPTRKRIGKLRMPRGSSKKFHVASMVTMLNLLTPTQRAECLAVICHTGKTKGSADTCRKLKGKLKNYAIIPLTKLKGDKGSLGAYIRGLTVPVNKL